MRPTVSNIVTISWNIRSHHNSDWSWKIRSGRGISELDCDLRTFDSPELGQGIVAYHMVTETLFCAQIFNCSVIRFAAIKQENLRGKEGTEKEKAESRGGGERSYRIKSRNQKERNQIQWGRRLNEGSV